MNNSLARDEGMQWRRCERIVHLGEMQIRIMMILVRPSIPAENEIVEVEVILIIHRGRCGRRTWSRSSSRSSSRRASGSRVRSARLSARCVFALLFLLLLAVVLTKQIVLRFAFLDLPVVLRRVIFEHREDAATLRSQPREERLLRTPQART